MSQDFPTHAPQLTAAFEQQFYDTFEIEAQRSSPLIAGTIHSCGKIQGSSFTINDMGNVKMKKTGSRFQDTEWSMPETGTRLAVMSDYDLHAETDADKYHIHIVAIGFFSINNEKNILNEDMQLAIKLSNAPAIVYSSMRDYVATITSRSIYGSFYPELYAFGEDNYINKEEIEFPVDEQDE